MPDASIVGRFKPANELYKNIPPGILVYGREGVGKTTFAATVADIPGISPVLLVDAERGGGRSIGNRADVQIFTPTEWADFPPLLDFLKSRESKFKAVILDSLTELQRLCMDAILKERNKLNDGPAGPEWMVVTSRMSQLVRGFKSLTTRGVYVIFTATEMNPKEQETTDLQGLIGPKMTKVTGETIREQVDGVVRLVNKRGVRTLHLASNGSGFYGKIRQPRSAEYKELPPTLEDPTMPRLMELLRPLVG